MDLQFTPWWKSNKYALFITHGLTLRVYGENHRNTRFSFTTHVFAAYPNNVPSGFAFPDSFPIDLAPFSRAAKQNSLS